MQIAKISAGIAAAAIVLALVPTAEAQSPKVWRHGILEAKSDAGILFMAGKGGFADKQGLNLEYVQLKSDITGLKAMLAGEVDSYEGGPQAAIMAANRGADVKIVGCQWLGIPHGIFVRGDINSLNDLVGKQVAISIPGSLPELLIRAALEQAKIPADKVNMASLGSDTERYKALAAGVVDAAIVTEEYVPIAEKANVKLLTPGREIFPKFVRTCIHMTSDTIAKRQDDAVKFLAAEMMGLRHVEGHKDEVVKITREMTGAKPDDPRAAYVYQAVLDERLIAPDLPIPVSNLAWMQDQLIAIGKLEKPIDIKTMVDGSVREKALDLAGEAKP